MELPRLKIDLSPKQLQAIQALNSNRYDQILFGGGAGGGKTYLGCIWLIQSCLQYPGSRWFMAREVLKDLKQSALLSLFEVMGRQFGMRRDVDYSYHDMQGLVHIMNGSDIYLFDLAYEPSDPDYNRLGSREFTGGFIEEAQEVHEKAIGTLGTRIRYRLDEFGIIGTTLLTCNPTKGYLYTSFYDPSRKGTLPKHKLFIKSLATDNPYLSQNYLRKLSEIEDNSTKERLLFGNWDYEDNASQLISYQWIQNALVDTYEVTNRIKFGIDIAREGKDKTKIAVFDGQTLIAIHELRTEITETTDISGEIADEILLWARQYGVGYQDVEIDAVGVGGGVIDALRRKGFYPNSYKGGDKVDDIIDDYTSYMNLRAFSYWKLRIALQNGTLKILRSIQYLEELTRELTSHNYFIDDKVLKLEKKEDIKARIGRSPDNADAVAIGFAPQPKNNFAFAFNG